MTGTNQPYRKVNYFDKTKHHISLENDKFEFFEYISNKYF